MEEWRDISGYEGLYQVSSCGRIKSLNYNKTGQQRILKQTKDMLGYKRIMLCKEGKTNRYLVHRLVANTFLENPNNYPCINHIDEQPYNNHVSNLEWCTHKYNNNYGNHNNKMSKSKKGKMTGENNPMYGRTGVNSPIYGRHHTDEARKKIRESKIGENNPNSRKVKASTGEIFITVTEAAKWSGTNKSNISQQIKGKLKHTGKHPVTKEPLQWKYIDDIYKLD